MTTCAPSVTKRSAVARPMPLAPPVTIATFPASSSPIIMHPPASAIRYSPGYPAPSRSRQLDPVLRPRVDTVSGEDRVDHLVVSGVERESERVDVVLDFGDRPTADERCADARRAGRPAQRQLRDGHAAFGRELLEVVDDGHVRRDRT